MLRILFVALFVTAVAARKAPAPSKAPAFWNVEIPEKEVLAEAGAMAPEPRKGSGSARLAGSSSSTSKPSPFAAAPAHSHHGHRKHSSSIDEVDDEIFVAAADANAAIAESAQQLEALLAAVEDDTLLTADETDSVALLPQLPSFIEFHEEGEPKLDAVPAEAAPPHIVAVGDDAIFAAADAAASGAAVGADAPIVATTSSLEAALEAAAQTGSTVVVVDDASAETVPAGT